MEIQKPSYAHDPYVVTIPLSIVSTIPIPACSHRRALRWRRVPTPTNALDHRTRRPVTGPSPHLVLQRPTPPCASPAIRRIVVPVRHPLPFKPINISMTTRSPRIIRPAQVPLLFLAAPRPPSSFLPLRRLHVLSAPPCSFPLVRRRRCCSSLSLAALPVSAPPTPPLALRIAVAVPIVVRPAAVQAVAGPAAADRSARAGRAFARALRGRCAGENAGELILGPVLGVEGGTLDATLSPCSWPRDDG